MGTPESINSLIRTMYLNVKKSFSKDHIQKFILKKKINIIYLIVFFFLWILEPYPSWRISLTDRSLFVVLEKPMGKKKLFKTCPKGFGLKVAKLSLKTPLKMEDNLIGTKAITQQIPEQ